MSKIEVNKAAEIIKSEQVDSATLRRIVEKMNLETQADPGKEKPPAVKKQTVIIISDPEGTLPARDYVGFVVQIPESESPATTLDRIYRSVYEFNTSRKGRLLPIKTVGEAMESCPPKYLKESEVWVKTRTSVLVIKSNNEVPREKNPAN